MTGKGNIIKRVIHAALCILLTVSAVGLWNQDVLANGKGYHTYVDEYWTDSYDDGLASVTLDSPAGSKRYLVSGRTSPKQPGMENVTTPLTGLTNTWDDIAVIVDEDHTINGNINVTGAGARIFLYDDNVLTINGYINVADGATLDIYGQTGKNGKLIVNNNVSGYAAIGAGNCSSETKIEIKSGFVEAKSSKDGSAGIGSSPSSPNSKLNIVIKNGNVTAVGGTQAAGIGAGYNAAFGSIEIGNATVTATGGEGAAGIGYGEFSTNILGSDSTRSTIKITGSSVTATGGNAYSGGSAPGIGGHYNPSNGSIVEVEQIIIPYAESITATGGSGAPGIGYYKAFSACRDNYYSYPITWNNSSGSWNTSNSGTTNYAVVTFNCNGGRGLTSQLRMKDTNGPDSGDKVIRPSDPFKTGRVFMGWYLNGAAYDFNSRLTGDITLVAMWDDGTLPDVIDKPDVNKTYKDGQLSKKLSDLSSGGAVYLKSSDTTLNGGSYVVNGTVTISGVITVNNGANIFLNKGSVLNAKKGIQIASGTLFIYEESSGTGTINVTAPDSGKAGIGGSGSYSIYLKSGTINTAGGNTAPGIGTNAGGSSSTGDIFIYGGTVNAYGGAGGGAGIGSGKGAVFNRVFIEGGTINATGNGGAGIGSGLATSATNGSGGKIVIERGADVNDRMYASGLVVRAVGENGGYGIGGSKSGSYEHKIEWANIHSGDVTLRGNGGAAGSFVTSQSDETLGLFSEEWVTRLNNSSHSSDYLDWANTANQADGENTLAKYKDQDVRAGGKRVTFKVMGYGAYYIPDQWVKEGEKVKDPGITVTGHKITSWSYNNGSNVFNFNDPLTNVEFSSPLQLTATVASGGDSSTCTARYILNNGTDEVVTRTFKKNTKPSQISVSRSGYTLKGWVDAYSGETYNFNQNEEFDVSLKAVWEYNGKPIGGSLPNTDSEDSRLLIALIFGISAAGAGIAFKLRYM